MEVIIALIFYSLFALFTSNSNKKELSNTTSNNSIDEYLNTNFKNKWDTDFGSNGVDPNSAWGKTRMEVFKRDFYKCIRCGVDNNLTVNHKVELRLGGNNNLNNLETLCKGCHERLHNRKIFDPRFSFKDLDNYGQNPHLNPKVLRIIACIKNSENISISYIDAKNNLTNRTITPENLFEEHGNIYLRSYCHLRNDERTFRLSRITIV